MPLRPLLPLAALLLAFAPIAHAETLITGCTSEVASPPPTPPVSGVSAHASVELCGFIENATASGGYFPSEGTLWVNATASTGGEGVDNVLILDGGIFSDGTTSIENGCGPRDEPCPIIVVVGWPRPVCPHPIDAPPCPMYSPSIERVELNP